MFAHENMKKPSSKVAKPAQIQPKSPLLFHKNLPPRDFSIMTLSTTMFFRPISSLLWPSSLFRNVHILANRLTTSIQNTDTFMFLTSPFFSRAVGISEILEGTYYRWLNPRKFLLFSKNVPKHYLEHFPQWEDAKDSYLAHFLIGKMAKKPHK